MKTEMMFKNITLFITILVLLLSAKNTIMYIKFEKVIDAIYRYNMELIYKYSYSDLKQYEEQKADWNKIKKYEYVLFNPFAWRCKDLVDKETWEKIEPYIDK